jgi:hypothetical protein
VSVKLGMTRKKTFEKWLEEAVEVWGESYSYDSVKWSGYSGKNAEKSKSIAIIVNVLS